MIRWILQIEGQNTLEVVYKSGVKRYISVGMYNNYKLNKTQQAFMDNSRKITIPGYRNFDYYVSKSNPDTKITDMLFNYKQGYYEY